MVYYSIPCSCELSYIDKTGHAAGTRVKQPECATWLKIALRLTCSPQQTQSFIWWNQNAMYTITAENSENLLKSVRPCQIATATQDTLCPYLETVTPR